MPCISDPGYEIVKECINQQLPMTVRPSPSAFTTALVLSGLPTEQFTFYGFLPQKRSAREKYLSEIAEDKATLIFYEAPHRLQKVLEEMHKAFGDRNTAVARELTKIYEEVIRGKLSELAAHFNENKPRGEFVIVVEGNNKQPENEQLDFVLELEEYMKKGINKKEAIKLVSERAGVPRREVYNAVHRVNKEK